MTWTHTSRGRALDMLDPQPGDVDLEEIGQALSQQGRYAGCTLRYYSVAEHSVLVGRALHRDFPEATRLWVAGLLHDAAEAYTGDITFPMQEVLFSGPGGDEAHRRYRAVQAMLERMICGSLDFDRGWLHADEVRQYDLRILHDERAVLLSGRPREWGIDRVPVLCAPLGVTIEGWMPAVARQEWSRELARALAAWRGRP